MAISFLTAPTTQLYTPVSVATQAADTTKADPNASPDITININDAQNAQNILGTLLGGANAQPASLLAAAQPASLLAAAPQQAQSLLAASPVNAVASPLVAAQPAAVTTPAAANPFGAPANLFGAPAGMGMAASPFGQMGAAGMPPQMGVGMPGMNPAMMGGMGAPQSAPPEQNQDSDLLKIIVPLLLEKLKGNQEEEDPMAALAPILASLSEEGDVEEPEADVSQDVAPDQFVDEGSDQ